MPPPVQEAAAVDVSKWEMGYGDMVLKKQIGSGQGGIVLLAYLKREAVSPTVTDYIRKQSAPGGRPNYLLVAVKRFRAERMQLEMDCFYSEVAAMTKVSAGAHPNVIGMVGCIPEQPCPAVVMEYAPLGNLHSFLLKYKNERLPAMLPGTVVVSPISHVESEFQSHYNTLTLEPQDVLHFGHQIASGMEFLAGLNILHRDLACRNILLAHDKVLKIADFGLSREVEYMYLSKSVCNLPVRWMAPEAVAWSIYTEQSDVWSFGVVLWEICTLGRMPYHHLSNSDAAKAISNGSKLMKPDGCSPELYSVMTDSCWDMEPDKRATFSELKCTLDSLLPENQESPPVDLDCELQQQAREACPTIPPTQHRMPHTPDVARRSDSEAPATLTCWSDPDPQTTEGNPSPIYATIEDCSPPTTVDRLVVTAEIHPPASPTSEGCALGTPTVSLPPPTLTSLSDADPRANKDTSQGDPSSQPHIHALPGCADSSLRTDPESTSSCDAATEDCQFAVQSTAGDDLEITPYSCVTLVTSGAHPLSPPTSEDVSNSSLPILAPPNLVVTQPTESDKQPPPLPPPRGRGVATGNRWEMRYKDLLLEGGLGWGKFGTVVRGTLRKDSDAQWCVHPVARLEMGQGGSQHQWRVAVKFMADSLTKEGMQAFYNEVAIMKRVSRGGNPHVITMVGYIPRELPPAIVMEFAPLSTLLKFLMKVKDDCVAALLPGGVTMPPPAEIPVELRSYYASLTLEPSDILSFGYQIASGMEFLTGLGILHRDLASRNVLMTVGKYLKVADFGLSRETKDVYVSQCFSNLPFRWMAPEALTQLTYTEKSDVWSFGVVLWEICSLGRLPYYHVRAEHVRETIISGGKLPMPDGCNPELYSVMTDSCWAMNPDKRATFLQFKKTLDRLITASLGQDWPYMDLNFVVQEQLREECPAALSTASMVAHPPASAEASDTMPGDACTVGDPDPAAEVGCVIPAASGQDESAEAIPLEDLAEPATKVLAPSKHKMKRVTFDTPM